VIAQSSGHCRSDPQRLVNPGEIIVDEVQRHGEGVILDFLGKRIGEPRKPPHPHPHREVLPFHEGRAYMLGIGIAAHNFRVAADATVNSR